MQALRLCLSDRNSGVCRMKEFYDVVVVGGGPAGSVAAWFAAQGGASVLLLEKNRDIGPPVRCAEGVGHDGLKLIVEPQPFFIQNRITGVNLIAPHGKKIHIENHDFGYVLNRNVFDHYLAELAAKSGAEIRTKSYASSLIFENDNVSGVNYSCLGKEFSVKCSIVIGADGVESRVGRWAGIHTQLKMKDIDTCVQYTLANIDVDPKNCDFYFSSKIAPGGYLWVFPKGEGKANVGLGIGGEYGQNESPKNYLDRFIADRFPEASFLTTTVGGVPTAKTLKEIVKPGFMLVGDAARQANPISGGGIVSGMIAGKLAGQVAADAVQKGDFSKKFLKEYEKQWNKAEGNNHKMFYRLKEAVYKLTDEDLNKAANAILKMPPEKRTIVNIFKTVLVNKPQLFVVILHVFKDHVKEVFDPLVN